MQEHSRRSLIGVGGILVLLAVYIPMHVAWGEPMRTYFFYILFGVIAGLWAQWACKRVPLWMFPLLFVAAVAEGLLAGRILMDTELTTIAKVKSSMRVYYEPDIDIMYFGSLYAGLAAIAVPIAFKIVRSVTRNEAGDGSVEA